MKCCTCDNPYHPATGHMFTTTLVQCGPCTRKYIDFLKSHTNRRWGKVRFYDHATNPCKD